MFSLFLLLIGLAASFASPVLLDERALGGRIVGGRDGNIEEVPWQVSAQLDGRHNCGGSIISEYWFVSVAHCFHRSVSRYSARVGSSLPSTGGTVHAIERYINHPQYQTPAMHSNDINVVKVLEPFVFSSRVQPISLPTQSATLSVGTFSTVSGFGLLSWGGPLATVLQIAEVPVVSMEQCRSNYDASQVTDDMLCAGFPEGGVDACTSDSGGPLVANGVLVGAVSWGNVCAAPNAPGVYADVAYFRDWIRENSGI